MMMIQQRFSILEKINEENSQIMSILDYVREVKAEHIATVFDGSSSESDMGQRRKGIMY